LAEEAGTCPGVLLVHGTAPNLWGELPAMLAADHRVMSYDRRSFGRSVSAPVASLRRHTQDAVRLLESLAEGASTLVGWSAGGLIALDLAATSPELVSGVVVIEAALFAKRRPSPDQLRMIVAAKLQSARGRPRRTILALGTATACGEQRSRPAARAVAGGDAGERGRHPARDRRRHR